jgi:hypothetical protein
VGKFHGRERAEVESIVASLTIKRIPDALIMKHIENKMGKSITQKSLWSIRQRIKRESYEWYSQLRNGEYEYLHEYKERINEIMDLQRMHHEIILRNDNDRVYNPAIVQSSLAELHKLTITLSNFYDVAPTIIGNSLPAQSKTATTEDNREQEDIIV